MITEKYTVEGMSCSACSSAVERAVGKINGVNSAQVSLMQKMLVCNYDENTVCEKDIFDAVKKAGFAAFPYDPGKALQNQKDNEKNKDKKTLFRLVFSLALLSVLMYISMGHMLGAPLPEIINPHFNPFNFGIVQLVLTLPVVIANFKFFTSGVKAFMSKAPNMDSLVCIGSTASLVYGVYNLCLMLVKSEQAHSLAMNLYFEGAATILTLVTVGKYLEERSKTKAGKALEGLLDLAPKTAVVLKDGKEIQINAKDINKGDVLIIKPGNMFPCDGIIIEGKSNVDQKAITGESMPVPKSEGDSVMSASVNIDGALLVKATMVGGETTLSKIIALVSGASATKAPIARLADKISGIFVPCVMSISAVCFILWLVAGYSFDFALSRAISVLVISCPCALGLATPVAITVASGRCSKEGILIKSAKSLEALNLVDTVVFDKTGTITMGHPCVTDIVAVNGQKQQLLYYAYNAEKQSEHPISYAICNYVNENCNTDEMSGEIKDFKAVFGKGVAVRVDGKEVLGGNIALMEQYSIDTKEIVEKCNNLSLQGKTVLVFCADREIIGLIAVADTVKDNAKQQIEQLYKMGKEVFLLTGDNKLCAAAIGKSVSIPEQNIFSEVLPSDKEKKIAQLQSVGKNVLMVGDGINDSPAMVRANVGMAIGSGADIAIDSADIVLMKSDLKDVCTALCFSKKTVRNIKENLFWAFIYNVLGIPVAAGVLYPAFGIVLNPMIAAAAMSFSSLFVVLNALRIAKIKNNF